MRRFESYLAFVLFFLASTLSAATDPNFGDAGAVLREETRVYLAPCFFAPVVSRPTAPPASGKPVTVFTPLNEQMAFPAIIGVAAAEAGLDFAIGALKAAGEDQSTQAITAYPANGWMYALDKRAMLVISPEHKCVQIISGSFWNGLRSQAGETVDKVPVRDDNVTIDLDTRQFEAVKDSDGESTQVAQWKSLDNVPQRLQSRYRQLRSIRFFFEASVDQMPGTEDQIFLTPNSLYFKEPIETSLFEFGKQKRNILVSVSFANAGAESGKALASLSFPFRDVPSETMLSPLYFRGHTSRAIQAPALGDDEKKRAQDIQSAFSGATSDIMMALGPPKALPFFPPDIHGDEDYRATSNAYCKAVEDLNSKIIAKNDKAAQIVDLECYPDVQIAKANLDNARDKFLKSVALAQAKFNSNYKWTVKSDENNIYCVPVSTKNGLDPQCELTGKARKFRPITVSAAVVEVKEGSKFLAFLGKVMEKAQPNLNTAIESRTPDKQVATDELNKTNQEAFRLAIADVAIAEAALTDIMSKADATAADKAKAQHDVLAKKIAANQAARKAHASEPYALP